MPISPVIFWIHFSFDFQHLAQIFFKSAKIGKMWKILKRGLVNLTKMKNIFKIHMYVRIIWYNYKQMQAVHSWKVIVLLVLECTIIFSKNFSWNNTQNCTLLNLTISRWINIDLTFLPQTKNNNYISWSRIKISKCFLLNKLSF